MASCIDVRRIVQQAEADELHRTLILVDEFQNEKPVWGRFVYPYDASPHEVYIGQLFEVTRNILAAAPESLIFTANTLPIITSIGKWKVTIITRISATEVSIVNGESGGIQGFFGLD